MDEELRFWVVDTLDQDNVNDLLRSIADGDVVGLADEEHGGIIAYILSDHADRIVEVLNRG